jgi:translation elongation factor EF-Tu-like GTPase
LPDIEVELTFLPTEHGGRKGPVYTGYRTQFYYNNTDWDAIHEYVGTEVVHQGQTVTARLTFLSPHQHWQKVFEGMPFLVREGNRVVGFGRVTSILGLEESARRSESRGE